MVIVPEDVSVYPTLQISLRLPVSASDPDGSTAAVHASDLSPSRVTPPEGLTVRVCAAVADPPTVKVPEAESVFVLPETLNEAAAICQT